MSEFYLQNKINAAKKNRLCDGQKAYAGKMEDSTVYANALIKMAIENSKISKKEN